MYRQQSKFNISNNKQAEQICSVLQKWIKESGEAGDSESNADQSDE